MNRVRVTGRGHLGAQRGRARAGARVTLGCAALACLALGFAADAGAQDDDDSGDGFASTALELPGRLKLHRLNYVLPLTWPEDSHDSDDAELKFQISLLHQVGQTPFYLGYTQVAYWRWFDTERSRPFREINFNPEVWYRFDRGRLPVDWLGVDVGYEHESNGEGVADSRSWDRFYLRPWFEEGRWRGQLKLWYRLPEDPKKAPDDPSGDDNPDILDYYGHHEARLAYRFSGGDRLAVTTRYAYSDDRGSVKLDYAIATDGDGYFFFQLFSGYGESLQTYRASRTRIGVGFALMP